MPASSLSWNKPMLGGLAFASCVTFVFGVWFWIFGSGGVYQIRYFVPFALLSVILAVPVMVRLIPDMHPRAVVLLLVPMAFSIVNMGMLLVQRNPSPEWQKWTGVNLSTGGNDVAAQARNFASAVKREGRDIILYSMPMNVTDADFQAVVDYARFADSPMPNVSIRRPVDWQRPTAYRVRDMLDADYWVFEPLRDRRVAEATLAAPSIDEFHQERALFQAWATQLTPSDGVAVVSETPTARVLRITDPERLESALDALIEGRHWRTAFIAANPKHRWSENDLADAMAQSPPALENIHFADRIELRALSVSQKGKETTVRIWWRPMPGMKERDWVFFVHSIDDQGKILLDHYLELGIRDQSSRDGAFRSGTITFSSPPREKSGRLAIGFVRPNQSALVADKGDRDWDGARVIVPALASRAA